MIRRAINWPFALAILFIGLLGSYLLYTRYSVGAMRADAEMHARIFYEVNRGVTDTTSGAEEDALFQLQSIVVESEIPLVMTGPRDTVIAVQNLPLDVDIRTPEGQAAVRARVAVMDARHPPVGDSAVQLVHFGESPQVRRLRWVPWLQVAGLLLTALVGWSIVRAQRRAESERAWTSMARELAHQLGTPISSLQGWLEVLRLDPSERPGDLEEGEVADALAEDLERLERISHRFELIGRDPVLRSTSLQEVVHDLERYLQSRLPRLGPGVTLSVDVPDDLPSILGNKVLLVWALENVVKNALDALAGRGGAISIDARVVEPGWVALRVRDNGPGVSPEVWDRIFEPGVTTKAGGWGVGLALSRRIVEGVHRGRIVLLDGRSGGTTFQIRLPTGEA